MRSYGKVHKSKHYEEKKKEKSITNEINEMWVKLKKDLRL